MVDVTKKLGGYIKGVLDDLREFTLHDWDGVVIVTGYEGDGKTSFVKLASHYLDQGMTIKNWVYNAEQFETIIDSDELEQGSNLVWDESDELSARWSDSIIQALKRKFKRIRKKRLIIWLITPTFFDMNKYWAIFRTRCLFDVYAEPKRNERGGFEANRGRVRFFNRDKKRRLYMSGVKFWDMRAEMPNFIDSFSKPPMDYPISDEDLEAKKDAASKALINPARPPSDKTAKYRQDCLLRFERWFTQRTGKKAKRFDCAYVFGCTEDSIKKDRTMNNRFIAENSLEADPRLGFGGSAEGIISTKLLVSDEEEEA